ncbi:MAG: hypothetical protein K9H64_14885 [Bacteroidales bacterium]|nr:hypothetical protein [Bacteroidales bacterium]MCF8457251.1 hypothetical protein [Bacteroidales bacterium]
MKTIHIRATIFTSFIILCSFFSSAQNWEWAHGLYADDMVFCDDICSDNSGNMYIIGDQYDTMSISGLQLPYSECGFVVKLNPAGVILLLKAIPYASARHLTVDSQGNIYVSGHSGGYFYFANSGHNYDKFIVKFDSLGNEMWAKCMDDIWIEDIVASPSNNLGFVGSIQNISMLDSIQIVSSGGYNCVIGEIDPMSNYIWANGVGGDGGVEIHTLAYDNDTNIIFGGACGDTLNIGMNTLNIGNNTPNTYLAKLSSGGTNVLSTKTFPSHFYTFGIEINSNNEPLILLSGSIFDPYYLDTFTIVNPLPVPNGMKLVCKMNSNWDVEWVSKIYSESPLYWSTMDLNSQGEIVVSS